MPMIQAAHNLRKPQDEEPAPYGIRISLRENDPFRKLMGQDWNITHWYLTAQDSDAARAEMSGPI